MDGVDVALTDFRDNEIISIISKTEPYPEKLKRQIERLSRENKPITLAEIADVDIRIGCHFADALLTLLNQNHILPEKVVGVGNHGQTLFHNPVPPYPVTWQIGNSSTIAARTGIPTVYDFRSVDVARGGQGAPLVPPFHQWLFNKTKEKIVVVNIGGISNISFLHEDPMQTYGFDCGPGNVLLDVWNRRHNGSPFDEYGAWASSGKLIEPLLRGMLEDSFFELPFPKSTGSDYFNEEFINNYLEKTNQLNAKPEDIQNTLAMLTVECIALSIEEAGLTADTNTYFCGGGCKNKTLLGNLKRRLEPSAVFTTDTFGLDPDFIEAAAFAWFARQRLSGIPTRLTTGTNQSPLLLGSLVLPPGLKVRETLISD